MKTYHIESQKDNHASIQRLLDQCKNTEATIVFNEGVYAFEKGLKLTAEHKNLTLKGEGNVRFLGGKELKNWTKVEGTPIAQRFDPEARDKIYVCDLEGEGISAVGDFVSRGFNRYVTPSHSELFCNGSPMNLSQYPKGDGFLQITDVAEGKTNEWDDKVGSLEGGFYYDDERPARWEPSDQLWTLGYWAWDWANSCEHVEILDTEKKFIRNYPPYGNYSYIPGQRFRFYHILEEVNQPGDYYIDVKEKKAYIYPEKMDDSTEITISVMEEPILSLSGSENIRLEGISFEAVRGDAVAGEYTEGLVIDNCYFKNIGNYAVDLTEGHNNAVYNSTIHDCGDGGVLMFGGNRCTLEACNATVNNNHIYNIAKWTKCYQPAIFLIGVGMTARHNLIHDCPHTAIMYWGNEMTIEDNEIYSVVLETGDAGAIYTGRDYTFRGNSVCHNYLHHLGGVGMGTMGIYNDDTVSGTRMNNHYFEELTRGAFMGGGRGFEVKNNVFVKCDPAIAFDCRGADGHPVWSRGTNSTLKERFYHIERYPHADDTTRRNSQEKEKHKGEEVNAMESVYIERYPELAEIDEYYRSCPEGKAKIPGSALIANNVLCSKVKFRYSFEEPTKTYYKLGKPFQPDKYMKAYITDTTRDMRFTISGEKGELQIVSNYQALPEDFVDADWGVLAVKPGSKAYDYGFTDSDFYSIGLEEEKRTVNPPKVLTRVRTEAEPVDEITIGLRNLSDREVRGNLKLYAPENVTFAAEKVPFHVGPGEETCVKVKIEKYEGEFEVEVRSDTAGVRPSRNVFEF